MVDRFHRFRMRLVDNVPLPFLTHAYEIAVALVLTAIALPVALAMVSPKSIHTLVPGWMAYGWGVFMVAGAIATVVGIFMPRPRLEWVGQIVLGYTLTFYSVALSAYALKMDTSSLETAGVPIAVFMALGAVAFWRAFKITSAPYVQHRLAREARDAQRKALANPNRR